MTAKEDMKKRLLPDYGDLYTVDEFISHCNEGWFTNYDGHGRWSDGVYEYGNWDDFVKPSDILGGKIRPEFTHIVWYNR
jgi:hypothetical protein